MNLSHDQLDIVFKSVYKDRIQDVCLGGCLDTVLDADPVIRSDVLESLKLLTYLLEQSLIGTQFEVKVEEFKDVSFESPVNDALAAESVNHPARA